MLKPVTPLRCKTFCFHTNTAESHRTKNCNLGIPKFPQDPLMVSVPVYCEPLCPSVGASLSASVH